MGYQFYQKKRRITFVENIHEQKQRCPIYSFWLQSADRFDVTFQLNAQVLQTSKWHSAILVGIYPLIDEVTQSSQKFIGFRILLQQLWGFKGGG